MNKLNAFMKERYDMKSFIHTPSTKLLPEIHTETIKGKRFYVTPEGKKYPSITTVLSVEVKRVSTNGVSLLVMM